MDTRTVSVEAALRFYSELGLSDGMRALYPNNSLL